MTAFLSHIRVEHFADLPEEDRDLVNAMLDAWEAERAMSRGDPLEVQIAHRKTSSAMSAITHLCRDGAARFFRRGLMVEVTPHEGVEVWIPDNVDDAFAAWLEDHQQEIHTRASKDIASDAFSAGWDAAYAGDRW